MKQHPLPLPLFDSLKYIDSTSTQFADAIGVDPLDFSQARAFLQCYRGSQGTFNSYRREIERLLQWCYLIENKSLKTLTRADIEKFVEFCQSPPATWITTVKAPKFIETQGCRIPNPAWRPFVATISKSAHRNGITPDVKKFNLSNGSIKEIFPILSTFFNYLLQEEYLFTNPVALIRQKSKFITKQQGPKKIRRLSDLQWQYVIESAGIMASQQPDQHERTLFIMSALYSLYLRISELAASTRWTPAMNHFYRDNDSNWWFTTVGKGNKAREIAVSDTMLTALKRWRQHLGLPALPSPADHSALLPKHNTNTAISSTNYLRRIVQGCFDNAVDRLKNDGFAEEAELLMEATVHWLRHTGISDDVKHRPRDHVRDDAGHSSGLITDRYVDVDRRERHQSAKKKLITIEP
jgi:site-specific recombinase XerD